MAGNTLELKDVIQEDNLGTSIARKWIEWDNLMHDKKRDWEEVRRYIYATDTTQTTNSQLPWKNSTTIPKLTQIRDNLYSNYMATMFPNRKWLKWEGNNEDGAKRAEAIQKYASYFVHNTHFKEEIGKLVLDYIDYGNCFAMADWVDNTIELKDKTQVGYVGPVPKRISPLDIRFNPIATNFDSSPKIIRSVIQFGEVKEILSRLTKPDTQEDYQKLWDYLKDLRSGTGAGTYGGDLGRDSLYSVDGFTSYQAYLQSDYCELLTFYGDIYDYEKDEFLRNHVIVVVDRHKVISSNSNPSFFGKAPIFHVGWRKRQDNLWAMGPLDNLVGMQYRLDHLENAKADAWDLLVVPPLKIRGMVDDFNWGPMERIYLGDEHSDVEMLAPPYNILTQNNGEIQQLIALMEEMAGSPKEAMGFRTPGEKTAYEVQRLENAASRIFQNKIAQFEETLTERLLNGMLELSRRKMSGNATVRVFDDEFQITTFEEIGPDDITGNGQIRPVAARHFAEQAELVQNLNQMFSSGLGQDQMFKQHWSTLKLAKLLEKILNLEDYQLVMENVRVSEQANLQKMMQTTGEQTAQAGMTPAGLQPQDYDEDVTAPPGPTEGDPTAAPMDAAPQG